MEGAQVHKSLPCDFMCEKDDKIESVSYCCDCQQYLCENCVKQHSKIKGLKDHTCVSSNEAYMCGLDEGSRACQVHNGEVIKFYCKDDDATFCEKCKNNHANHSYVDIGQRCEELQKAVANKLKANTPTVQEIRKAKVEIEREAETMSLMVKKRSEFLKAELDALEARMQTEIKKYKEDAVANVDQAYKSAEERDRVKSSFDRCMSLRRGVSLYDYLKDLDQKVSEPFTAREMVQILPPLVDTCIDPQTDGRKALANLQMFLIIASETDGGCQHYRRNCHLLVPCCNKVYTCHYCHDNNESHALIRKDVSMIMCSKCTTVQKATTSPSCSVCDTRFGTYTCNKCVLYDMEFKNQYHCDKCGICRLGPRENYVHCDTCDLCVHKDINTKHRCVPPSNRLACPVCSRTDLKITREPCKVFSCAHFYHLEGLCPYCEAGKM